MPGWFLFMMLIVLTLEAKVTPVVIIFGTGLGNAEKNGFISLLNPLIFQIILQNNIFFGLK